MRSAAVRFLVVMATSLSLRCIPWAQNLTGTPKLPDPAVRYFDPSESVLVLPVWFDNGPCKTRGPVVLSASSLGELEGYLKPRWRLGVMGIDGHGPSHYRRIHGFLLVGADGRMVWASHRSPITTGALTIQLRADLSGALSTNGPIRAGTFPKSGTEPFFGFACKLSDIGTKLDGHEQELTTAFLQKAIASGGS